MSVSPMSSISNQFSCSSTDQHSGAYDCMYMQFTRCDWCPLFAVLIHEILKEVQASNSRVVELKKKLDKMQEKPSAFQTSFNQKNCTFAGSMSKPMSAMWRN